MSVFMYNTVVHCLKYFNGNTNVGPKHCMNGSRPHGLKGLTFYWISWIAIYVCILIPIKKWYQDTLWRNIKLSDAVWWFRQRFIEKHWIPLWFLYRTYHEIIEAQVHLSMATIYDGIGNAPCHTAQVLWKSF